MNLQQIRYLCAVVDHGFNISKAAKAVRSSQPGLSTQIRALESELNAGILLRRRGRIVGLTEPGLSILEVARRMLHDVENLRKIGSGYKRERRGVLALGMTHTGARHGLIEIIEIFRKDNPEVQLNLRVATPPQIFGMLSSGALDIGIVNEIPLGSHKLVTLPCPISAKNDLTRHLFVPVGHVLTKKSRISLKDVAVHPMIMMDDTTTLAREVLETFQNAGLEPKIVMRANALDVIKAYVELGFGITVLPGVAYNSRTDHRLRALNAGYLFGVGFLVMAFDPNAYLRGFVYDFIQLVAPEWTRERIDAKLDGSRRV